MEIYIEGWKLYNQYAFERPDIYLPNIGILLNGYSDVLFFLVTKKMLMGGFRLQ